MLLGVKDVTQAIYSEELGWTDDVVMGKQETYQSGQQYQGMEPLNVVGSFFFFASWLGKPEDGLGNGML